MRNLADIFVDYTEIQYLSNNNNNKEREKKPEFLDLGLFVHSK